MLRDKLTSALKESMIAKDSAKVSTLRLILAAIKDRDISIRTNGHNDEGIKDEEILKLFGTMVKQRRDSIAQYEKGNRPDLAAIESKEIEIIQGFMPKQMDDEEIKGVIGSLVKELNVQGLKDMGKLMAALREKHAGQMDFGKASGFIKDILNK